MPAVSPNYDPPPNTPAVRVRIGEIPAGVGGAAVLTLRVNSATGR
jgi:hypothetical protein